MESFLVNEDFVSREDTYNLKNGGSGGFEYINNNGYRYVVFEDKGIEFARKMGLKGSVVTNMKRKNNPEYAKSINEKISKSNKGNCTFLGKKHTDETKKKIGSSSSKHQKGKNNSQYGTIWVSDPDTGEKKKISKDDTIPEGWIKGYKKPHKPYSKKCPVCNGLMPNKRDTCSRKCSGLYRSKYYQYKYSILKDYLSGKSLDHMKSEYGFSCEQSLTAFLNRHFPDRKRFKPKERTSKN